MCVPLPSFLASSYAKLEHTGRVRRTADPEVESSHNLIIDQTSDETHDAVMIKRHVMIIYHCYVYTHSAGALARSLDHIMGPFSTHAGLRCLQMGRMGSCAQSL